MVVEEFVGALPRIAVGEDRSLFLFIICSFRDTVKSYKMHVYSIGRGVFGEST